MLNFISATVWPILMKFDTMTGQSQNSLQRDQSEDSLQ